MTNLITAQELSELAPDLDTSAYSATTISGLIAQASKKVAAYCNVKDFALSSYTDTDKARINNNGELLINPRVRPLQSLTSVTLERGGFSTSITLTQDGENLYQILDPGNQAVIPNSYLYATGTFLAGGSSQLVSLKYANLMCTVTYVAGWQTLPDDLKDACVLWVQDMIMRRVNRAGAKSFSQGSLSMSFGSTDPRGMGSGESMLVAEAKSILTQGGYVKVGGF